MTPLTNLSPTCAAPRYATSRAPGLASYGDQVALIADALGWPLLPWQRQVADIACQVNDDGTWRYPTVILTTPRQSGKSTLLGAILTHRAMTMPGSYHWYTAQTGKDANETWGKWAYKLDQVMPGRWGQRLSQGTEHLRFNAGGGQIRPFAPTPKSLHGQQSDTAVLDEIWAFDTTHGDQLMQAVVPTQATRRMRQLFLVSTAGDDTSTWFRSWIERGRDSINDPNSGIAYLEWSAPDDAPHDDPATWATWHPGYGHLIDDQAMASALDQFGLEGFSRGYLNRWPTATESWRAAWPRLASTDRIPPDAQVFIAADASLNQRHAAISVAAALPDGRIAVEVVDARPGTDWLGDRLLELHRRHKSQVIVGKSGPLAFLIDDLTRQGVRVEAATVSDYAAAGDRFRTLVTEGRITHPADPRLDQAVAAIDQRSGVNRTVWLRAKGHESVDVAPLIAASFAVWKAALPPARAVVVTR